MLSRPLTAVLLVALYAVMCAAVWWRHRRRQRQAAQAAAALLPAADAGTPVLVLHASQTGQAEEIAWNTARSLHVAGMPVRVAALGQVGRDDLMAARHALIIASTHGEGDAPDSAVPFARDLMSATEPLALGHLQVGVMALGDRTYTHFCGFGRALDAWLTASGATPLFERIDVDRGDARALAQWRQHLSHLVGTADLADWDEPVFDAWQLRARHHLNPGSQGGPVYHLELMPSGDRPLPSWEAGDLVQVCVSPTADDTASTGSNDGEPATTPTTPDDAQRPREYTIASLPADGAVALMVRRTTREDGTPGWASGWLTERLPVGATVALRLRSHPSFRIGGNASRPLILIGNGTGLAGLRAHLKARAAQRRDGSDEAPLFAELAVAEADWSSSDDVATVTTAATRVGASAAHTFRHQTSPSSLASTNLPTNLPITAVERTSVAPVWLLFGERQSAHDAHYRDEIDGWQREGLIAQADWAFSRDQGERIHVQHLLARHAQRLREWVANDAAIYVCGSLQGMAGAVDAVLRETLGDAQVDALIQQGRYRRDVY